MSYEYAYSEKCKELRQQFERETGSHPFADQKYIQWLEQKIVKESVVRK